MSDQSRRFILRERTSEAHASLDELISSFSGRPGYERYLRGMYAFRAPVEERLSRAEWPETFSGWRPHAVAGLVREDLDDLGLDRPSPETPSSPALTPADLLGISYVLEGSALGARILYQRAQAIGLGADHGARHLAVQSGGIQSWRDYVAILEAAEPFDVEATTAAALAAFQAAEAAFMDNKDAV